MPEFEFEAMDATGQEIRDVIDAPTEEEAQTTIRQMGYFVTKITEKKTKGKGPSKGGRKKRGFAIGGGGSKVVTSFTRQLSILQDAGLPIVRSLNGPSAFSTVKDLRWQNLADTAGYTQRVLSGASVVTNEEPLSASTRRSEAAAFGMRMAGGLSSAMLAGWQTEMAEFRDLGLVEESGDRIRLTRRGKLMADSVAEAFV